MIENPYYGNDNDSEDVHENPENTITEPNDPGFTMFTRIDNIYYGESS